MTWKHFFIDHKKDNSAIKGHSHFYYITQDSPEYLTIFNTKIPYITDLYFLEQTCTSK